METERTTLTINPRGKLYTRSDCKPTGSLRRDDEPQPQGGYYLATSLPVLEGQIAHVDV